MNYIIHCILAIIVCTSCGGPRRSNQEQPVVRTAVKQSPPRSKIIVIDAGHGGEDPGARRKEPPRLIEKNLTLYTANCAAVRLKSLGYRVIMTRTGDYTVPLFDRVRFADRGHGDIFVSIHYNSCPKSQVQGIEVYFFKNRLSDKRQIASELLGKCLLDNVVRATKSPARGVRHGNFCVIRETKMPAVLVECGYITSPQEAVRLSKKRYLQRVALGIASGIDSYFRSI